MSEAKKSEDPIVKGINKVLSFMPENLNEEEQAKVAEIRDLLAQIEKAEDKKKETK